MKLKKIKKGIKGAHVKTYTLEYENKSGHIKNYEMISRRNDISTLEDLQNGNTDAIVVAVFNPTMDKILLEREFRLPVGKTLINFPAGLIELGETCTTAAKREIQEETGVNIYNFITWLEPAYGLAALTNEKTQFLIAIGEGEINGHPDEDEEIEAFWASREDVLNLLEKEEFSSRTQLMCFLWAKGLLDISMLVTV